MGSARRDGGGFLFAIGSHMVDSLLWWMDEEITEVYGDLRTQVPAYNGDAGLELRDAEDAFTFTGCFKGGASFLADVFFRGSAERMDVRDLRDEGDAGDAK